ncbi:MAG: hypothetical protein K0Q89_36 [Thermomicrobiales bacterium]|jgi:hypothetical protein|nr:hypothetical protein [Thermomicrobiales bacterium]
MKRLLIIPIALLGLVACQKSEPQIVYRTLPPTTVAAADEDVLALDMVWPQFRGQVCDEIAKLGGLTPAIEQFGVEKYEEGYGKQLSSAGDARLRELMREC